MPFAKHLRKKWGKDIGWKCEVCGVRWKDGYILEGHHIIPTSAGGTNTRHNFRLLCLKCHAEAHRQLEQAGIGHKSYAIVLARFKQTGGKWK